MYQPTKRLSPSAAAREWHSRVVSGPRRRHGEGRGCTDSWRSWRGTRVPTVGYGEQLRPCQVRNQAKRSAGGHCGATNLPLLISNRLFARRAAYLAHIAARWAADSASAQDPLITTGRSGRKLGLAASMQQRPCADQRSCRGPKRHMTAVLRGVKSLKREAIACEPGFVGRRRDFRGNVR